MALSLIAGLNSPSRFSVRSWLSVTPVAGIRQATVELPRVDAQHHDSRSIIGHG